MKKIYLFIFITMIILTACGTKGSTNPSSSSLTPIQVKIEMNPDSIKTNEATTIKAIVTQGSEKVEDAKEVQFEIWKQGQSSHEMIKANHQTGGVYSIQKTFDSPGNYDVISHVTAREMHTMPKKEFKVSN